MPAVSGSGLMRIDAEKSAGVRRAGAGWRALSLVLLLAFTVQSFVTQTHLHGVSAAGDAQIAFQTPHHGKTPLDEGVAACPFCQAAVHAGAFFAPASPILVLPASSAGFAAYAPVHAALRHTIAHAWYSRAPPQPRI